MPETIKETTDSHIGSLKQLIILISRSQKIETPLQGLTNNIDSGKNLDSIDCQQKLSGENESVTKKRKNFKTKHGVLYLFYSFLSGSSVNSNSKPKAICTNILRNSD